jgi:hypothetical protein
VLDALVLYVQEAPPQRLLPLQKVFIKKLATLLIHKLPDIRMRTVSIFAEFHRKIPGDFSHSLKKFSPTQARLIELRAEQLAAKQKGI